MVGEVKRNQVMQNLFGDQSDEEGKEEEENIDSEHESNPHPNYASDEAEGGFPEALGEDEAGAEIEAVDDVDEGHEGESYVEPNHGESEAEREQSSQEEVDVDVDVDQREESEAKETDSDEDKEDYEQPGVTSRRRELVQSASDDNHYPDNEDEEEEVDEARSQSKSPKEGKDQAYLSQSAAEIRDVFGDSDDDEEGPGFAVQDHLEKDSPTSPMEEEEDVRPEDMVPDEDARYESEEERIELRHKEKPVGPPLELEIPLLPPPAEPSKMNMIKVSNIMGIDLKKFDPKTYEEEKTVVTDESGSTKRIRLQNNIVRYREIKNPDGSISCESNARIVKWSDGSLQLLIGNEVLDISVQDSKHDHAHLFLRHDKGILQSQGRILKKMRFMPSSLTSNSHRLLTAVVDSRIKKTYKVKNCVTDIDPEREKEEKERAESQNIRANVLLNKKREKVNRKYMQTPEKKRQLSTGFLEDALEEDDEQDYYDSRRPSRHFEEDLEAEARAEKRIMNAKKSQGLNKDIPRKTAAKPSRRPVNPSESEREESEYETDGEEEYERSPQQRKRIEDSEPEYEEEEGEEEEEHDDVNEASEEEAEGSRQKGKEFRGGVKRKEFESDEEDSPRRKAPTHRRMAVVYDSDDE